MKDPAALLYVDKWIASTQGMAADERGWYMDLILHQHDKGSVPMDRDVLAGICRVRPSEFKRFEQVFEQVLVHKFEQTGEQTYINPVMFEILRLREKHQEKKSFAGNMSVLVNKCRMLKASDYKISRLKEDIKNDALDYSIEELKDEQVLQQVLQLYIDEDVVVDRVEKEATPKEIAAEFHKRCPSLNPIQQISDSRRSTIRSRLREYGKTKMFEVFDKTQSSSFLTGANDRKWIADFDWLLQKKNFILILEGKYDNRDEAKSAKLLMTMNK